MKPRDAMSQLADETTQLHTIALPEGAGPALVFLNATRALHDHLCPRQVLGVRMGMLAAELLGMSLPQKKKRLLTFVETDGCFADGIAVATGCWMGHRTLRLIDHGKVAATFVDTASPEALAWRITPAQGARALAAGYAPEARNRWEAMLLGYQRMPIEELLAWRQVTLRISVKQIVSQPGRRNVCEECGEEIINAREVIREGKVLCCACAGDAYFR